MKKKLRTKKVVSEASSTNKLFNEIDYGCEQCDFTALNYEEFKSHVESHQDLNKMEIFCVKCEKTFDLLENAMKHTTICISDGNLKEVTKSHSGKQSVLKNGSEQKSSVESCDNKTDSLKKGKIESSGVNKRRIVQDKNSTMRKKNDSLTCEKCRIQYKLKWAFDRHVSSKH